MRISVLTRPSNGHILVAVADHLLNAVTKAGHVRLPVVGCKADDLCPASSVQIIASPHIWKSCKRHHMLSKRPIGAASVIFLGADETFSLEGERIVGS